MRNSNRPRYFAVAHNPESRTIPQPTEVWECRSHSHAKWCCHTLRRDYGWPVATVLTRHHDSGGAA